MMIKRISLDEEIVLNIFSGKTSQTTDASPRLCRDRRKGEKKGKREGGKNPTHKWLSLRW